METSKKRRFQFVTPDGELIETGNSNDTFTLFIDMIGADNVAPLNLMVRDEPLILDEAKNGWHKPLSNAKFLNTFTVNVAKISICKKICKALNIKGYHFSLTDKI